MGDRARGLECRAVQPTVHPTVHPSGPSDRADTTFLADPSDPGARSIEALALAATAAQLADQKKGADIRVLELEGGMRVADYLVIATGLSRPQVKAMYEEIHARLKAAGETHTRAEGTELGWWILLDFGDVVVHLMQPEAREYYDLESLYRDAIEVDWRAVTPPELPLAKPRRRAAAAE